MTLIFYITLKGPKEDGNKFKYQFSFLKVTKKARKIAYYLLLIENMTIGVNLSELVFNKVIKSDEIEAFFEGEVSNEVKEFVTNLNLRYRDLTKDEFNLHKNKCLDYIHKEIIPSGPKRQKIWDKGWGQNLSDVIKKGIVKIHCCNKILGSGYHEGWTFLRWEKLV